MGFKGKRHSPEARKRIADAVRKRWRQKGERARRAQAIRKALAQPEEQERRSRQLAAQWTDPEYREARVESAKQTAARCRESKSRIMRRLWRDPDFRRRALEGYRRAVELRGRTPSDFVREWFDIPEGQDLDDVLRADPWEKFNAKLADDYEEEIDEWAWGTPEENAALEAAEAILDGWEEWCR